MLRILILPNTSAPLFVGVYRDFKLEFSLESTKLLSDSLVSLFLELENRLKKSGESFSELYFVRGPGSFMALKLIYIFAKTLEISRDIRLFAADAFNFNQNSPIKAYGNCYFIKEAESKITLKTFEIPPTLKALELPQVLDSSIFSQNLKPLYILPPV